jgi:DNA repair ATPase RecN
VIVDEAKVRNIDTKPVADSSRAVSEAVTDVVDAGRSSRAASDRVGKSANQLIDAMKRLEEFAKADTQFQKAYQEIQIYAKMLSDDLFELTAANVILEEKGMVATTRINTLNRTVNDLERNVEGQRAEMLAKDNVMKAMKVELDARKGMEAKLAVSEDKLQWWRWKFAPVAGGTVLVLLLFLLLAVKGRIPLL